MRIRCCVGRRAADPRAGRRGRPGRRGGRADRGGARRGDQVPGAHRGAGQRRASPTYGISTGFGALATRHIPPERRAELQRSLVRSHAAGAGPEVEREVVRALMLLRLRTLATGHTGVRPATAQALRRAAQRRHHAGRPRVRLARLLRRPRAAVARRARADGRGRGPRRGRRAAPAAEALRASRDRAGRAGREGGPGADQRHRRHARHAGAGPRTTCARLLDDRRPRPRR